MSSVNSISRKYMVPTVPVRRFTVAEYAALIEDGFFSEDEQFELLDGFITPKMSRNPPHDAALNRIRRRLEKTLAAGWMIRIQSAITTPDSAPEPDIAIVRGDDADYATKHPVAEDISLIVEIANTSLFEDRSIKLDVYASAGIPVYWIANLTDSQVEVYSNPSVLAGKGSYLDRVVYKIDQTIPGIVGTMDERSIPVNELLFPVGQ